MPSGAIFLDTYLDHCMTSAVQEVEESLGVR